ncbi:Reverse transcriptase domain [Trinorchestia longiramus]|nr:Reverse transcriptase domain [Trinorchestia longiramus]
MLQWLQAYLKDRSFKVSIEDTYSSVRIAKSGVPQGVLSPLLFNITIHDMLVKAGICSCEYANDLAFYTHCLNLHVATDTPQQQLPHSNSLMHFIIGQNNAV